MIVFSASGAAGFGLSRPSPKKRQRMGRRFFMGNERLSGIRGSGGSLFWLKLGNAGSRLPRRVRAIDSRRGKATWGQ